MKKFRKTVCKNKPHQWVRVARSLEIWPYEIEKYRLCLNCGRKIKTNKVAY